MNKVLVVAAANETKLAACLTDNDASDARHLTLLTTKGVRLKGVDSYIDVDTRMLSEDIMLPQPLGAFDSVVVVQHSRTLVQYMNVYRFLQANGVERIAIKTAGHAPVNTSISNVIDNICGESSGNTNTDNLYFIDPQNVAYCAGVDTLHFGQVVDGDWDLQATPFEQRILFYSALKQVVEHAKPWSETDFYQDLLASVEQGDFRFGCKSQKDIDLRCDYLLSLYHDIKEKGWQQKPGEDYVTINIGRNGDLLFADGRHRLSIAKLLGLKEIPVKIAVRHAQWAALRNQISSYADSHGGQIYAPIEHIDLKHVPYNHEDQRFAVIAQRMGDESRTLLDIGSHWGRACSVLESYGHRCTAVEGHVSNFSFLNRIRQAEGKTFTAINQSIFDFVNRPMHFDVVLALNIFHHFLKTESALKDLTHLLDNLDTDVMFLQTHAADEEQMSEAYMNLAPLPFAQFIAQLIGLSQIDKLMEWDNGRVLFQLSRSA